MPRPSGPRAVKRVELSPFGRREGSVASAAHETISVPLIPSVKCATPPCKIEVLHGNVEAAGFAGISPLSGAGLLRRVRIAGHGLSAGGVFPWRDVDDLVSREARIFGFQAAGIVAGTAERVGNAGLLQKVLHDGVAPDDGMAGLVFEPRALILVELRDRSCL